MEHRNNAKEMKNMPRWIKLENWAHAQYGDDAPDPRTLRRWAREGHLFPPAEQHGKCWYVTPNAKYTDHATGSILDRMRIAYGTQTSQPA